MITVTVGYFRYFNV